MKRSLAWSAAAIGMLGFFLLLWRGPWWFDGSHLRDRALEPADGVVITGFRTMMVAMGAGVVAGVGLYYTHQTLRHTREKDARDVELTREGQLTDRYVEAIKLLGSDNPTQRIGGIYALERIMRDSERDHAAIVEVLAAYIRNPPSGAKPDQLDANEKEPCNIDLEQHIQAALTVLCRRPRRPETFRINLARANLRGADLTNARLDGADLSGAQLQEANLDFAQLKKANLSDAQLTKARMDNAQMQGADLNGAQLHAAQLFATHLEGAELDNIQLRGAYLDGARLDKASLLHAFLEGASLYEARLRGAELDGARLNGADLGNANLDGATLSDADLSSARGLQVDQLASAELSASTLLPRRLAEDPRIKGKVSG
ncbi:pentapeptide repeat-containing protein [Streptomyces sp. NPDC021098]|uniref:pentapeptide repeat-containing protein n=1 Tax=unclassified Streptomyces TaxID=2593676 RepID=UPI0037AC9385